MLTAGSDRLAALMSAIDSVRRGGTISISGVYGAPTDPLPMFQLFDKQVQIRMGQANVHRWSDDILELLQQDEDVLGVESFATHHLPLEDAPEAYRKFRDKEDGMVKVDSFRVVDSRPGWAMVEVVLHEGRNHIVRRLLEETGHPVESLVRTDVGPVQLGELRPGKLRPLSSREIAGLYNAAGL